MGNEWDNYIVYEGFEQTPKKVYTAPKKKKVSERKAVEVRTWYYENEEEEDSVEKELFIDGKSVLYGHDYEDRMTYQIDAYLKALTDNGFKLKETIYTKQQIV